MAYNLCYLLSIVVVGILGYGSIAAKVQNIKTNENATFISCKFSDINKLVIRKAENSVIKDVYKSGNIQPPFSETGRYFSMVNDTTNTTSIEVKQAKYFDSGEFICGWMKNETFEKDGHSVKLIVSPGEPTEVKLYEEYMDKTEPKMRAINSTERSPGDNVTIVCVGMMEAFHEFEMKVKVTIMKGNGADFKTVTLDNTVAETVNETTNFFKSNITLTNKNTVTVNYKHNDAIIKCQAMNAHDSKLMKEESDNLKIKHKPEMMADMKSPPKVNEKNYTFNLTVYSNPTVSLDINCTYHEQKEVKLEKQADDENVKTMFTVTIPEVKEEAKMSCTAKNSEGETKTEIKIYKDDTTGGSNCLTSSLLIIFVTVLAAIY